MGRWDRDSQRVKATGAEPDSRMPRGCRTEDRCRRQRLTHTTRDRPNVGRSAGGSESRRVPGGAARWPSARRWPSRQLLHDGFRHAAPGDRLLRRPGDPARAVAARLASSGLRARWHRRHAARGRAARRRARPLHPRRAFQSRAAVRSRQAAGNQGSRGGLI